MAHSTSLGSGIVSAGLQCGSNFCNTNKDINLTETVTIIIEHSEKVEVSSALLHVHQVIYCCTQNLRKNWQEIQTSSQNVCFGSFWVEEGKLHNYIHHYKPLVCILCSSESDILSIGQWSNRGCNKDRELSNISVTVCECSHLTHFAILLSPVPLDLSRNNVLSLQVISYVGVVISLIAMAITIATFTILK